MTVAECSLTTCVWARFLIGSHTMPGQGHGQHTLNSLGVIDVCVFRCNLPPALLTEWPGSFTCHCGNTGMERTPNKSQHTKLILEKKILPPLLPGFELATFWSRVRCTYQQAIPTHHFFFFFLVLFHVTSLTCLWKSASKKSIALILKPMQNSGIILTLKVTPPPLLT